MKQVNDRQYVDQFFERCSIGNQVNPEQFWRLLDKRFGKLARDLGECTDAREHGQPANPYQGSRNRDSRELDIGRAAREQVNRSSQIRRRRESLIGPE